MTETLWIALIAGIPIIITSIANLIVTIRSNIQIDLIEKNTNSMKDALVKAALIEGELTGKTKEIAKQKDITEKVADRFERFKKKG